MPQRIKRPRVFVVDDELAIVSSLAMTLRQSGYTVVAFTAPHEALQAARFATPEVLVSDIDMPSKSGIDLAVEVQELCPDCKVLLVSGEPGASSLLQAAQAQGGAFEVIAKPVDAEELLQRMEQLTMAWAGLQEA